MDKLDEILLTYYKKYKNELAPAKQSCPQEELLWAYGRGKLTKKEREQLDGHLLACTDCLESFRAIRMIQQVQESTSEAPGYLYRKVREIMLKAVGEPGLRPKNKPIIASLNLVWDQVRDKITQLKPDIGEMISGQMGAELQPVRNISAGKQILEATHTFPYRKAIDINEGTIFLEIDHSDKEGYLALKTSFHNNPKSISKYLNNIRAVLYKSERVYSSVYLDKGGYAVFSRVKNGKYFLELITVDQSIGMVELSIDMAEN